MPSGKHLPILGLLFALFAPAAVGQARSGCAERWSLHGFRLGMTMDEARDAATSAGGRLVEAKGWTVRGGRDLSWCRVPEQGEGEGCAEQDLYRLSFVADRDGDPEVAVRLQLNAPADEVTWEALEQELERRWGPPESHGDFVDPSSSAMLGVFGRRAVWNDPACDVRATLSRTLMTSFWERNLLVETTLVVERLSRLERKGRAEKSSARDLVAP